MQSDINLALRRCSLCFAIFTVIAVTSAGRAWAQGATTTAPTVSPQAVPLHGLEQVVEPAGTVTGATSPVSSFFQLSPALPPQMATPAKKHSGAHKAIVHTLDNIGVPMFGSIKLKDSDIDPSLTRPFVMPQATPAVNQPVPSGLATTNNKRVNVLDPDAVLMDSSQLAPDSDDSRVNFNKSTSNSTSTSASSASPIKPISQ